MSHCRKAFPSPDQISRRCFLKAGCQWHCFLFYFLFQSRLSMAMFLFCFLFQGAGFQWQCFLFVFLFQGAGFQWQCFLFLKVSLQSQFFFAIYIVQDWLNGLWFWYVWFYIFSWNDNVDFHIPSRGFFLGLIIRFQYFCWIPIPHARWSLPPFAGRV